MIAPGLVLRGSELSELRHNLRTPVNHILGYGEMLIEDAADAGNDTLVTDLRGIHEDGKRILEIINNALTPATNEVHEDDLRAMHERLAVPLNAIIVRGRTLANSAAAGDLGKIENAAQRLLALSGSIFRVEAVPVAEVALDPVATVGRPRGKATGRILVVDDNESNRDVLGKRLQREGYTVSSAANGRAALEMVGDGAFDLVLLDIMMPEVDGFEVLQRMKGDASLCDIPVIMISALDEIQSVVRCIETGAEDYLQKPFDPVLLRARIGACLEKKRLRDEQKRKTLELEKAIEENETQRCVTESLLRNILPSKIADELRTNGHVEPSYFEDVTILFCDFVGFTRATEHLAAEDLVNVLHTYFTAFDRIVTAYGLEKLKTIGDSYMLAGGLPVRNPSHPVDAVMAALDIVKAVEGLACEETPWRVRVGLHTGPVIAGVVGIKKFAYDVWGESVNFSNRMESAGSPNRVNISGRTYSRVKDFFTCESRGKVKIKEGTEEEMYFVTGVLPKLLDDRTQTPPPAFHRRYKIYFQRDPPSFPKFLLE